MGAKNLKKYLTKFYSALRSPEKRVSISNICIDILSVIVIYEKFIVEKSIHGYFFSCSVQEKVSMDTFLDNVFCWICESNAYFLALSVSQ